MSQRFYPICIHKSEWDRLKRQGGPLIPETNAEDSRQEYLDALTEQSRKWMAHWPDSAEGVLEKFRAHKKKQRKKNHELLNWYKNWSKQEDPEAALKRAKQMIFDDSCYGRQLISAVTESKILEEREAQIEFKKKIRQHEAELEKNKKYGDSPIVSNMTEKEIKANRKLEAIECVKFNKEMEQIKKERAAELKAEKAKCVDEDLVKQVLELEKNNKTEKILLEEKGLKEYEAERKDIAKQRKNTEDLNNSLTTASKKELEKLKCKMDSVHKKILEEKRNGEQVKKHYKVIDKIQKAERNKYIDFIEKGIEMQEQKHLKQEANDVAIKNKKRTKRSKVAEENKIAGKLHKLYIEHIAPRNKCVCDVQTLLFKPDLKKELLKKNRGNETQESKQNEKESLDQDKLSFLKRKDLEQALRRREKDPKGYTGRDDQDQYFAEQASDALQRSKHKYFARKVIDDYIKKNHLIASELSIKNS